MTLEGKVITEETSPSKLFCSEELESEEEEEWITNTRKMVYDAVNSEYVIRFMLTNRNVDPEGIEEIVRVQWLPLTNSSELTREELLYYFGDK